MAENQFTKLRKEKLAKIRAMGIDPYPVESARSHKIGEVLCDKESRVAGTERVILAGRLVAMRRQGKLGFGNLEDDSGKIQLYVSQNELGEDNYSLFKLCDAGDFVQAEGNLFFTQAGEY
ncbi:MAG: lysine--tRNA ligase, partial [Candidatus Cloacimonetes bacterium]|nr:lysine--tRNA ligase [Candidatus Cloacimonadota bacterium]